LIMSQKLTDPIVKNLPAPATGNKVHYDSEVKGFGCRVTKGGARSFVLNYRTRTGRERGFTILTSFRRHPGIAGLLAPLCAGRCQGRPEWLV
jgi:hypothetical protein